MKKNSPFPSKINCIQRLLKTIKVSSVVDVGVRECTDELIKCFPNQKHYLFEPMRHLENTINNNYKNIEKEIHFIALSDEDSSMYLIETSLNKDGLITHSSIQEAPVEVDNLEVVSCNEIIVRRFDSLPLAKNIEKNFLLKIDVDGKDLHVLNGFGDLLKYASVIIVECTYNTFIERSSFIEGNGFSLVDFVDIVYYGESLYQFDAVFFRVDLINNTIRPSINSYDDSLWMQIKESKLD